MLSPAQNPHTGLAALLAPIEASLASPPALAQVLAGLAHAGALDDAAFYPAPRLDRYARRLIWHDPGDRFVVVGFTWAPGQVSALHDHAGLAGAEVVVEGTMKETLYELVARDEERYRFVEGTSRMSGRGATGVLQPPREHHAFGNPGTVAARTLHVYCGNLTSSLSFERQGEWWSAKQIDLTYDA
jgi:predicted metal-dependent enzyme (double-stranded beta helix superfamily)